MKKLLPAVAVVAATILIITIVVFANLHSITSYVLSRATGERVEIGRLRLGYSKGCLSCEMEDLSLKGVVAGAVKNILLILNPARGFSLTALAISDFDLTLDEAKEKTGIGFFVIPQSISMRRGSVVYKGQKIFIDDISVPKVASGEPFAFSLAIRSDHWFKTIHAHGEGTMKRKTPELAGKLHVSGLKLHPLYKNMKGEAHVDGTFNWSKRGGLFEGPFHISDFQLEEPFFSRPLVADSIRGKAALDHDGKTTGLKLEDVFFKNTHFTVEMKFSKEFCLITFRLSSGFIDLGEKGMMTSLKSFASINPWHHVTGGKAKIKRMSIDGEGPAHIEIDLKETALSYKKLNFTDIKGFFSIDHNVMNISHLQGALKTSRFSRITGMIPLEKDGAVSLKGDYTVNLKDIPSVLDTGDFAFNEGTTEGFLTVSGNEDKGFAVSGAGRLDNAGIFWKRLSASANGSYTFANDEIAFDPLVISKGKTNISLRGKWKKKLF